MKTMDLAAHSLRQAFSTFPTGVVAVCGVDAAGRPAGMAVSSFVPISLDPPLVGICLQKTSRTWPDLRRISTLGISVLCQEQREVARLLSMKEGDRFAGVPISVTDLGAVMISGAAAYFEVQLSSEVEAGDHLIAVLEVASVTCDIDTSPLLFHRSGFAELRRLAGQ